MRESTESLTQLLDIQAGGLVSLVGAGGKTTTMYRICGELAEAGHSVVSTTTTAIQPPTRSQSPALLVRDETESFWDAVPELLAGHGHVTTVGRRLRAEKLAGLELAEVTTLRRLANVVVVEADGARHMAVKAPAGHEPAVHPDTTHFLSVAGLHALGRPWAEVCHRPAIAAAITGAPPGGPVSVSALAALLGSDQGGLKGRPPAARAWALLTHLTPENAPQAVELARRLRRRGAYAGVLALSRTSAARLA